MVFGVNVRCVKAIIELLIVYEIFQQTNLYDFCFEILLTTRLAKILMVKQRINCELILCSTICVHSATRHNIEKILVGKFR